MLDAVVSLEKNNHITIVTATVMTVLTTIAVALRLSTRFFVAAKFGTSEILLIMTQAIWYTQYAIQMWDMMLGREIKTEMDPRLAEYRRINYINGEFYVPLVTLCNFSILCLYQRLFPLESFKRATIYVMIAHIIWAIPAFITETAMCTPPSILWTRVDLITTKCIFYSTYFIVMLSVELLLDVAVLALPVIYIVGLTLPWKRRAELLFCFLLGALVIVTGIVRIVKASVAGVRVIDYLLDILWGDVHAGTAIICACLPTYRPLVVRASTVVSSSVRKVFGSGSQTSRNLSDPKTGETDCQREVEPC